MGAAQVVDLLWHRPFWQGLRAVAWGIVTFQDTQLTIRGVENVPASGGAVFAINHVGYLDPVYAGLAIQKGGRRVRMMGKAEVRDNALAHFIASGSRWIAVDREAGARSYGLAVSALQAGDCVGIFPEATISRSFELKKFKSGAARMAVDARVPLVPNIVWGSQRIATKGRPAALGRTRIPVLVQVGERLEPEGPPDVLIGELKKRMTQILRQVQDEYGTHPQGEPWVPHRLGGSAPTLEEATELDERESAERRARKAQQ